MSKRLMILNIVATIGAVIVCLAACAVFFFTAQYANRWWITLFSIVPLVMFNSHGFVLESDIQQSQLDELSGKVRVTDDAKR